MTARWAWPLLALTTLAACGSGASPPQPSGPPRGTGDETPAAAPSSSPAPANDRDLAGDATYADLLDVARGLDQRRDTASDEGCLLGGGEHAWRLAADLAPAIRPLPEADTDLDARLSSGAGEVTVLTRWGPLGRGHAEGIALTAVTTTLPTARSSARVWFVTDRGVYVRSTDGSMGTTEPTEQPRIDGLPTLFIAAEAGVPLSRLAEVLAMAPRSVAGHIGLAVALAEGTRLPEPAAPPATEGAPLCPEGVPPLAEEAPYGSLSADQLRSQLGPLRERAAICVSTATGPGAAGGRFDVAVRIDAEGAVGDACVQSDSAGDPALRGCLVRALRDLRFDAPSPPGVVDVALPLVLSPAAAQRQAPLCP
ncbi:MAG: hypothetical protein AB8I08_24130 [Sandaracinaceae bacterium]